MKDRNRNNEARKKDNLLRHWENLVLTYHKMCKHPTVKFFIRLVSELAKILLRILMKKIFDDIFDEP